MADQPGARPNALAVTRRMIATVAAGLVTFFIVVIVVFASASAPAEGTDPVLPWTLVGVGAAVGSAGTVWNRRRKLPCTGPEALRAHYTQAVFMGIAMAEIPAVTGFVATFMLSSVWPYALGGVLALLLLWAVTPTERELARRDAALTASGCPHSLRAALTASGDRAR